MFDVVVIGAGQAGLSAAYHLRRRGLDESSFVVLDANEGPGGAWRHRWPSLTFGGAHAINDLPAMPLETPDPTEPASAVVTRYYGTYEQAHELPVVRPVRVTSVTSPSGPDGPLLVTADDLWAPLPRTRTWLTRSIINATGTWDRPYWPFYPGRETFRGRQLHTKDFWDIEEFRGQHVVVVGGGTSAVQFLLQLEGVATTTWATRNPPQFTSRAFDSEWGRDVERRVSERTAAGLPPLSVVATTGLPLTDEYKRGIARGTLVSRGMFESITADGVLFPAGPSGEPELVRADVILWATGFRSALDHLAPLRLREAGGGIRTEGVRVVKDPRVLLVGYGASASTLGATRAGRHAAIAATSSEN